jgi:hypothetical protein
MGATLDVGPDSEATTTTESVHPDAFRIRSV